MDKLPPLDMECAECYGRGVVPSERGTDRDKTEGCDNCNGEGRVPTPEGLLVLAFLGMHGGDLLSRMLTTNAPEAVIDERIHNSMETHERTYHDVDQ